VCEELHITKRIFTIFEHAIRYNLVWACVYNCYYLSVCIYFNLIGILQCDWLICLEQHWLCIITWVDMLTSQTHSFASVKFNWSREIIEIKIIKLSFLRVTSRGHPSFSPHVSWILALTYNRANKWQQKEVWSLLSEWVSEHSQASNSIGLVK
jgi:hypothetical protein